MVLCTKTQFNINSEIRLSYNMHYFLFLLLSLLGSQDSTQIKLIKNTPHAVLSTIKDDTPFNSITTYALDADGNPIIFISDLAVHTENITNNPKCSLIAVGKGDDIFDTPRFTWIGEMKLTKEDKDKKAYLAKYPDYEYLTEFEDFHFYKLEIKKCYYVPGFGGGEWYTPEEYQKLFKKD